MAKAAHSRTFIDLFSGCGGLSLGLSQAGWKGLFAVERAKDAFETFRANFIEDGARFPFDWPKWLEERAHSIDDILAIHRKELIALRGSVGLLAGGPPCQGFSFAGRRSGTDPRNRMFERYVAFVDLVRPSALVLENVPGMNVAHGGNGGPKASRRRTTFYDRLVAALAEIGYAAQGQILDAAKFGVPQRRVRIVVVGTRTDSAVCPMDWIGGVFRTAEAEGSRQLLELGGRGSLSSSEALSDLTVGSGKARASSTIEYVDAESHRGFLQMKYKRPSSVYQVRMNEGVVPTKMDSMRLARHSAEVAERFGRILECCRRGVNLNPEDRAWLGMLKHRTVPMDPASPAPTLTTLPDDVLHYAEPRILTVRESARIQSFPDWFVFKGKYTTGGKVRRVECPRYTQVGNAVPPLLARAIGIGLLNSGKVKGGLSESSAEAIVEGCM